MKAKILCIIFFFVILSSSVSLSLQTNPIYNTTNPNENEIITINVAFYTDEDEDYFYEFLSGRAFIKALDYKWKVGNTTYEFNCELISTRDILKGKLNTENFDMLIYPPDTADEFLLTTGFSNLPKNKIRVSNIKKFVESGGGYYGSCGGALIAGTMKNEPTTFLERSMKNSCLGISGGYIEYHASIPILNQFSGKSSETISTQAYLFYSGWEISGPHDSPTYSGIPIQCTIDRTHPIYDDVSKSTRKINWIGAPPIQIPEYPDRQISAIASFPEQEICENDTTKIHHWTYTGGLMGCIKGQLFGQGEIHWFENMGVLMKAFAFSSDWKRLDSIVQSDYADKPFMTAEIYPNENQGRIVRCSGHPEFKVWFGGHIEETVDDENNNIYEGFHNWVNVTPFKETIEDEVTYNHCLVRRFIAWAAKVSDDALPPFYGPSQICDITSYDQESMDFSVYGNAEKTEGITELGLYFRYSEDNSSWSDWELYEVDDDYYNGWKWDFNSPFGNGYYQFYSIRNVYHDGYNEIESIPPCPDASVHVNII